MGWGHLRARGTRTGPSPAPPPGQPQMGRDRAWPAGLVGELGLAVPPTLTVLVAFLLAAVFAHRPILFASLASSAFLVYRDPLHRMNDVRAMLVAQMVGLILGVGAAFVLHPGYLAAAMAMIATIILLIALHAVHPPAVSTALGFAFSAQQDATVAVFLLALVVVAILILLERRILRALHARAPRRPDQH